MSLLEHYKFNQHPILVERSSLKINRYICFLILFAVNTLTGQRLGIDILDGKSSVEIPFQLQNGFITVDLSFDNKLGLTFIFDTGADNTILFHKAYADLLGIQYSKKIEIKGSDLRESQFALIARNIPLRLQNQIAVPRDVLILEEALQLFQESLGFDIDGILGGSFFRGLVVELDYTRKKIRLYHPTQFKLKKKGYTSFDIEVIANKPYIYTKSIVNPRDTTRTKLLIDTGAAIPYLLHANTDSSIVLPDYVINGTIGHGLSGNLVGFMGKIHGLSFGPFEFNNIITLFQDLSDIETKKVELIRNGILGNELLSRFSIYIDYLNKKLYAKPRKKYNKNFKYDKSGLIIFAFGPDLNQFYVKDVFPNTPAAEVGILPGDIIKKVGIWKSTGLTLDKIVELLQRKDGKKIKMKLERDGVEIKKQFILRDLFQESGK